MDHTFQCLLFCMYSVDTLRPRQNDRPFADDIFKCIFLNENVWMIMISLKFVSEVRINNIPALVQIMAWRRPGDKPLSEPMVVRFTTHICVTRPQWVNVLDQIICWKYNYHIYIYAALEGVSFLNLDYNPLACVDDMYRMKFCEHSASIYFCLEIALWGARWLGSKGPKKAGVTCHIVKYRSDHSKNIAINTLTLLL